MNSLDGFFLGLGGAALIAAGSCLLMWQLWRRRFRALQAEVKSLSEDLLQGIELQSEMYRIIRRGLHGVEERVLELSVPSSDAPLPLERRHQVLTLARRGISTDEIASRLNMPRGEAELILNLRRFADASEEGAKPPVLRNQGRKNAVAG
jgi:hypothetical protein